MSPVWLVLCGHFFNGCVPSPVLQSCVQSLQSRSGHYMWNMVARGALAFVKSNDFRIRIWQLQKEYGRSSPVWCTSSLPRWLSLPSLELVLRSRIFFYVFLQHRQLRKIRPVTAASPNGCICLLRRYSDNHPALRGDLIGRWRILGLLFVQFAGF